MNLKLPPFAVFFLDVLLGFVGTDGFEVDRVPLEGLAAAVAGGA